MVDFPSPQNKYMYMPLVKQNQIQYIIFWTLISENSKSETLSFTVASSDIHNNEWIIVFETFLCLFLQLLNENHKNQNLNFLSIMCLSQQTNLSIYMVPNTVKAKQSVHHGINTFIGLLAKSDISWYNHMIIIKPHYKQTWKQNKAIKSICNFF